MSQSKNFGFGENEAMLRDSARRFFMDHCSADKIHAQVAAVHDIDRSKDAVWDRELWRQITELGWTAACIPEAAGGVGLPAVAAVAIAEEAGRAAFPSPLLATFCATFLLRAVANDAAMTAMQRIAAGAAAALAISNANGSWAPAQAEVRVDANDQLSGTAYFVQDAQKVDFFVVAAINDAGLGFYAVDAGQDGVSVVADGIVDLTRDQARVVLEGAQAIPVASGDTATRAWQAALPAILATVSADMVGAGEWLLQTTAEYARTRVQFDRPIGFFQAIKHPLVNVMIAIDRAKSLTYNAACAADEEPQRAEMLARMAKSAASDMAHFSASRAVQFHGGIGFTWECYVHLFFKRQMHSAALFGDAKLQRRHLATLLFDQAA